MSLIMLTSKQPFVISTIQLLHQLAYHFLLSYVTYDFWLVFMPGTYVKMAPVHLVHKFNPPITDKNVIFLVTVWN